jgi:tetratricopeptide (TPR) repeat protein
VGKVEHPFEHLTDAQIEHYGDRTSGEGPNQNGLEVDQAIETHLADCAGCRIRVLEFHRSRFGLMSNPSSSAPSYSPSRSQSDPDSSRSAETEPGGKSSLSPTNLELLYLGRSDEHRPTPDCPTADSLCDLAAGLSSSADAPRLTQHAAQCPHCGPILRAYTEDFSDDLSPDDEALPSQLKSSSLEWQKKMAQQMAAAVAPVSATGDARVAQPPSAVQEKISQAPKGSRFRLPSLKWFFVPAGAIACALIALFIWNAQRETPQKVEKLLAQAYTEQRTMEMRIPYAAHSDFKQTRGDTGSLLNSPEALRKATDVIAANLKKSPDDPHWLLLSARLDLLDWNYEPALSSLDKVVDSQISDSPEFLLTKSLALYERSEVSKESQGYFLAVDLLGRALQKTPDDPVLLFNRAVACEKIHSYECAKTDWEHFLGIEKDPTWAAEAHKHLDQINEKKNPAQ